MSPSYTDSFLTQTCFKCRKIMELSEGTILYDGKWYHRGCWSEEPALEETCITPNTDENTTLNQSMSIPHTETTVQDLVHETGFTEIFEHLYQNSPDMYRMIDKKGIIKLCNKSYAKHLGYLVKEIIGKSIFDHIAKENLLAMQDSFETWKSTGIVKNREVWFKRKNGTKFLGLISANNMYDRNGKCLGSNTVIHDITEIYHARKEIEEREAKIRADFQELKKVNLLKDEFLAMITHELKTPLVPIKGYVDILLSEQFGSLNDIQKQKLEIVSTSANSLLGLISDLLDAQKIELGRLKLFKEKHDLEKIIRKTIVKMSPAAERAKVTISADLRSDTWCICDPTRIEQVLNNTITNAIKFVKPKVGRIQIKLDSTNDNATIVVKDNGTGIPSDQLDKVFLKFYQVSSSNTREQNGTGLGLAICRGIIESHGGEIWATSDGVGNGTEIHISLPLDDSFV